MRCLVYLYYTQPFYRTSTFGQIRAYCVRIFTVIHHFSSGDYLLSLPIAACGLRHSDDAVRVAVSMRLGCSICVAHTCKCGASVDTYGQHALKCKKAVRHPAKLYVTTPLATFCQGYQVSRHTSL